MKKRWAWMVLLLTLCLTLSCYAAKKNDDENDIPRRTTVKLPIDSTTGPVTANELKTYRQYIESISIAKDNHDKNLAWTSSRVVKSLGVMYELTGDEWYLDQMVKMSDQILSIRNDPANGEVDYVTGRILPAWPNNNGQFTANGQKVSYTNDVQTGMILDAIAATAYTIMTHPTVYRHEVTCDESYLPHSGVTYLAKAQFYLQRCQETIGAFIDYNDLFDPKTQLFRFPDNPRMNEVIPAARGLVSAYNRMFAMGRAMLEVADSLGITDSVANGNTIHRYDRIITTMVNYWRAGIEIRKVDQVTCYLWYYASSGKAKAPHYEDINHLGIDVQCLLTFYSLGEGHFGITTDDLKAIANTYFHIMQIPGTDEFSIKMDGPPQDKKKSNSKDASPASSNKGLFKVIGLTEVEPEMYQACASQIRKTTPSIIAEDYPAFLTWKDRRLRGNGK